MKSQCSYLVWKLFCIAKWEYLSSMINVSYADHGTHFPLKESNNACKHISTAIYAHALCYFTCTAQWHGSCKCDDVANPFVVPAAQWNSCATVLPRQGSSDALTNQLLVLEAQQLLGNLKCLWLLFSVHVTFLLVQSWEMIRLMELKWDPPVNLVPVKLFN